MCLACIFICRYILGSNDNQLLPALWPNSGLVSTIAFYSILHGLRSVDNAKKYRLSVISALTSRHPWRTKLENNALKPPVQLSSSILLKQQKYVDLQYDHTHQSRLSVISTFRKSIRLFVSARHKPSQNVFIIVHQIYPELQLTANL